MKTPKLLKKAEDLLSGEKLKRRGQKKALKELLRKLKKRKRKLQKHLETDESKAHRERIRKDLAVIHAQRKKGLSKLKELQ